MTATAKLVPNVQKLEAKPKGADDKLKSKLKLRTA
ncbi:hypothetical protein BH10CYA1_BH10CYA1_58730 [soil metagenome]